MNWKDVGEIIKGRFFLMCLHTPPIVARISHDTLLLDPRTVLEEQDEKLTQGLIKVSNKLQRR